LASLKKLAGQTAWYGLSNIGARLLNYLLTPIVTYLLNSPRGQGDYGDYSVLMAALAFVNVVYTYGMETAYFRFSSSGTDQKKLFQTTFTTLIISTFLLSAALIGLRAPIAGFLRLGTHTEYITWCVLVVSIDTLSAIPFARLRQEERPRKYAFTKLAGIVVNIFLTVFFIAYSPMYVAQHPTGAYAAWYAQYNSTGFLLLALLGQSIVTFLLLVQEWGAYRFRFYADIWKKVMWYSAPMVIVGLGGMVNETLDRIMLDKLMPGSPEAAKIAVGIYSAQYKLAIFITLFIQAFRMSAEPFFFNQSKDKNAPKTYARVMKWFVIVLCVAFLFTSLYIDVWERFLILGSSYRSGAGVVPILLSANVCLGIYYNLSVWYKITDRMYWGMIITLVGAVITLVINFAFIPLYGMYACAWATFAAYSSMMILSYFVGQMYFPVPYNPKKLLAYLVVMITLFFVQQGVGLLSNNIVIRVTSASVLFFLFLRLVFSAEQKEMKQLPFLGKFVKG